MSNGPTGPGIDFTNTNRTHACEQQLNAFLTTPSPDTFRALWNVDTLASYWAPSAGVLLGSDSAVDSLHDVCGEMRDADAFDPTWLDRLAGSDPGGSIHELYARLQGGTDPIPTLEAQTVLRSLGYDDVGTPDAVATAITDLAKEYESVFGHTTTGASYEVPLYAEN